jgi:glycosyltransferase involved in cell wall biosynthesis
MRIAYLINQYPAVSHSFIRREIQALEKQGASICRIAIRRSSSTLMDSLDVAEQARTRYVLEQRPWFILTCLLRGVLLQPVRFGQAVLLAFRTGRCSERGLLINLAYVVEATVAARWCKQDGIEHIHAHFGTNSASVAMMAGLFTGIPYSFTVHGPEEFDRPQRLALSEKIHRAAFVVGVSSFGRSQLLRWCGPDSSKVKIIRCGLDGDFHSGALSVPPASPRFVYVGRLAEQKGLRVLIDAVRQLRECGRSLKLVLVGDGPLREEIERRISDLRLRNCVRLAGWLSGSGVRQEIECARALVLPSFAEGLPAVIMEAMALQRPVISTYVAGIPELVVPGITGWLVPAGDEAALAEALRDALQSPPERLAALGRAARELVLTRHDAAKEAAKLAALFKHPAQTGNPEWNR